MTSITNSHNSLEMPSFIDVFWQAGVRRGNFTLVQIDKLQCRSDLVVEMFCCKCFLLLLGEPRDICTIVRLSHILHEKPVSAVSGSAGNKIRVMLIEHRVQRAFLDSLYTFGNAEDACSLGLSSIPDFSVRSTHVGFIFSAAFHIS